MHKLFIAASALVLFGCQPVPGFLDFSGTYSGSLRLDVVCGETVEEPRNVNASLTVNGADRLNTLSGDTYCDVLNVQQLSDGSGIASKSCGTASIAGRTGVDLVVSGGIISEVDGALSVAIDYAWRENSNDCAAKLYGTIASR